MLHLYRPGPSHTELVPGLVLHAIHGHADRQIYSAEGYQCIGQDQGKGLIRSQDWGFSDVIMRPDALKHGTLTENGIDSLVFRDTIYVNFMPRKSRDNVAIAVPRIVSHEGG